MSEGNEYKVRNKAGKLVGYRWQLTYKHRRTSKYFGRGINRTDRERLKSELATKHRAEVDAAEGEAPQEIPLFRTYAPEFLDAIKDEVEPKTLDRYRADLELYVIPEFGGDRLHEITPKKIKAFIRKKYRDYSRNSVRLMRASLSVVLTEAVEDGHIASNPCFARGKRRRVKKTPPKDSWKPLNNDERESFIEACDGATLGVLFVAMLRTGLRPGEAYALEVGDLDLAKRTLMVTKSIELGSRRVKGTKTGNERPVEISPSLVRLLKSHCAGRSQLLFPSQAGTPLDHSNVARKLEEVMKAAGLSGFSLYDLRHSYPCYALSEGLPLLYVAQQMGSSPETILRHYAKWIPRKGSKLAAAADGTES